MINQRAAKSEAWAVARGGGEDSEASLRQGTGKIMSLGSSKKKQTTSYCELQEEVYSILKELHNYNFTLHTWISTNAFSALTLLVGRQEGHPACKN